MWVCIEIDLDDVGVWTQVDKILCEELGLTHVIWGMNSKKKNVHRKIPSNLFYGDMTIPEKELIDEIKQVLESLRIGYNIVAIDKVWSHSTISAPKEKCSLIPDDSEISSREE